MSKGRIYIAGPMRGHRDYNFPAFDTAAALWAASGWEVVNPAQIDREMGFTPDSLPDDHDWTEAPEGMSLALVANRDLLELLTCDAIALLPGWETSKGATAEKAVAEWIGLEVVEECLERPASRDVPGRSVCADADVIVSGARRGTYGHPKDNFSRTGKIWAAILGLDTVTPEQVGLCMAGVKLAREAFAHKRDNLVDLCGYAKTVELCHE